MMEIKDNYFLYFTLFYIIGSVYGACPPMLKDGIPLFTKYDPTKTYTGVRNEHVLPDRRSLFFKQEATPSAPPVQKTTTDKNVDKEEKITIQEVFDKFFLNNTFKDECISKHNQDFWKFKSSENKIKPNPAEPTKNSIFTRKYVSKEEGKQPNYEATGKFFMQPGTPYISWDAQGGIEGYKKHEQKSGQIYILDIQNVQDPKYEYKSLITYYSCFEGNDFLNDNIYISQTMVKYNTGKEVSVNDAIKIVKEKLKSHTISSDLKAWQIECYQIN